MTKAEFLSELRAALSDIDGYDADERVSFYSEMIDDLIDNGASEEDAVKQVGPIGKITNEILSELPLFELFKNKVKPRRGLRGWELGLIIGLSPIWVSLLISAFAVAISLAATLWSIVASLWLALLSFALGSVAGTLGGIVMMFVNDSGVGLMTCGAGIALAGLTVFTFYACKFVTKGAAVLTKAAVLGIKRFLI